MRLKFLFFLLLLTTVFHSKAQWKTITLGTTSDLNALSFADQKFGMLVGNAGTIYKTSNAGATWVKLTTPITKDLKDIQYLDSLHAFIINADSLLYKTSDGGTTWQTVIIPRRGTNLVPYFKNYTNGIVFTNWNGIQKTTDAGATWTLTNLSDQFKACKFFNADTGFYSSGYNGLFKTVNGGSTWKNVYTAPNTFSYNFIDFSFTSTNGFVITSQEVYRTLDNGDTWKKANFTATSNLKTIESTPTGLCFAAGTGGYFISSSDAGINWASYTSPTIKDINDIKALNKQTLFAVGAAGTFLKYSKPSTTTWNGKSWSDGIPDSTQIAVINYDYNTSSNGAIKAKKLVVNANYNLIIDNNKNVTLKDSVVNNGNILVKNATISFSVNVIGNKINQEINFFPIPSIQVGSSLTLTPTSGSGLPVSISINNSNASLNNSSITAITLGKSVITAYQTGSINFNAATPATQELNIVAQGTTIQSSGVYPWYENKPSATVLTYDDFSPGQPVYGIPELIKRNLVGSFYVTIANAWRSTDYPIMMTGVDNGIEIGNHTNSHPHLPTLAVPNLISEINDVQVTINQNVTNQKCYTFAYPYGEYNQTVLDIVKQKHIASRAIDTTKIGYPYNFAKVQDDYFKIPTVEINPNVTVSQFSKVIKGGIKEGGLVTFMIHSINGPLANDTWFDAITDTYHAELLDTLSTYRDRTWITTFSNAVRYHKEANSSTLSFVSDDASATTLFLTDTLSNNSIYNHPLSIYYISTSGTVYSQVKQNGIALPFTQGNGMIRFNAIPDNGVITLIKEGATTVTKKDQTITFSALASKTFGDPDFTLTATSSSGLEVKFISSNTNIATVDGNKITIVSAGNVNITAIQEGNDEYNPAVAIIKTLGISKANQVITFDPLPASNMGDNDFNLSAVSSSGLPVKYISSNTDVATVSGNVVTIVGIGVTTITAIQDGNNNFNPASSIDQQLNVTTATSNQIKIKKADITLIPNPIVDNLSIQISQKTDQKLTVTIYNLQGEIAFKTNLPSGSNGINASLINLEPGLYLLELSNEDQVIYYDKIIKR